VARTYYPKGAWRSIACSACRREVTAQLFPDPAEWPLHRCPASQWRPAPFDTDQGPAAAPAVVHLTVWDEVQQASRAS
jgi:hypothetical protein